MTNRSGAGIRIGRAALIDAAANMFAEVGLEEVTGFLGPRSLARRAGVAAGTVTYHFPGSTGELMEVALAQAHDRVGDVQLTSLAESMDTAGSGTGKSEETAIDDFLLALARNIEVNSPDDGPADPVIEARETAFFLAASVAPRDQRAARALEPGLESNRLIRESIAEHMLTHRHRRWKDGITKEAGTLAQEALVFGFLLIRRFSKARASADVYAAMAMRLFDACTVPESVPESSDYRDTLLVSPKVPHLDSEKRMAIARAAAEVYQDFGWQGLTTVAVAERAGVSRPTVVANFKDRRGLAAAVWARHLPELRIAAKPDNDLPVLRAVHNCLERLVAVARRDRALSGAYLEGVFAYGLEHGPRVPDDPADPRNLVPLPQLLEPTIQRHAHQFRHGYADTERRVSDTAALLTDHGMHIGMLELSLSPSDVAARICGTTLSGMLRRRPPDSMESSLQIPQV